MNTLMTRNEEYHSDENMDIQSQEMINEEIEELPPFSISDYEDELEYFKEYDQEMMDTYDNFDQEDASFEEEYDYQMTEEESYVTDESLLKLIVDVQNYLHDAPQDSPLFALQYKMYTYLKQRAFEMGMDVSSF